MCAVEAKELLVPNPLLSSELEKYIWVSDSYEEHRNAQILFDYLMKRHIYVKGFATKAESLFHLKMYNKEILDIDTLDKENTVVFYDAYFEKSDLDIKYRGERARIVVPDVIDKEVVIWGTGEAGEYACRILMDSGIDVKFFVDSNKDLQGTVKCGLQVYEPDKLEEIGAEVVVVETMKKWKALDEKIRERYLFRFHYCPDGMWDNVWRKATCVVDGVEKEIFKLVDFWMFSKCADKKIYIYGCGGIQKEFRKYIELLDFEFGGYLVDKADYENITRDRDIRCMEEILNENDYYIWAYDKEDGKKLRMSGFSYLKQFVVNSFPWDITIEKEELFDINLGHIYSMGGKYPGIVVHGDDKEENYKIAVLGSSGTDGSVFPFKAWPQLLYEELGRSDVTVYNGGISAYTSGQELFRLIRDILLLRPDMILVYDSYSELFTDPRYPFAFKKTKKMIGSGLQSDKGFFGNWLDNMRSMYAISQERGIKFFVFCQPWLVSKKGKNEQEKNMVLSMPSRDVKFTLEESFRKHMEELKNTPAYLHDLSHIFDGEHDVYMDAGHMWEKGNRIIAREIKKIILEDIIK